MTDVHHFEINVALIGDRTTILMDGRPVVGVRSVCVNVGVDEISKITLEIVGTASVTGDAQVWIKDSTQEMFDRTDAAEAKADAALIRTGAAEARADAAEANSPAGLEGATLAYIVPVGAVPVVDGEDKN